MLRDGKKKSEDRDKPGERSRRVAERGPGPVYERGLGGGTQPKGGHHRVGAGRAGQSFKQETDSARGGISTEKKGLPKQKEKNLETALPAGIRGKGAGCYPPIKKNRDDSPIVSGKESAEEGRGG